MSKDWTFAIGIGVTVTAVLGVGAAMGETGPVWPVVIFVVAYGLTYVLVRQLSVKL